MRASRNSQGSWRINRNMWEADTAALIPSGPPSNQGGEAHGLYFTAEETHAGRLKCPPEVLRQVQLGFAPTPASPEASVLSALLWLLSKAAPVSSNQRETHPCSFRPTMESMMN